MNASLLDVLSKLRETVVNTEHVDANSSLERPVLQIVIIKCTTCERSLVSAIKSRVVFAATSLFVLNLDLSGIFYVGWS